MGMLVRFGRVGSSEKIGFLVASALVALMTTPSVGQNAGRGGVPLFGPDQRFGAGFAPFSVAIADLNGDGSPDLAVANRDSDDVSVLLGNSDGTFQAEQRFGAGSRPYSVAIGDLDGDGTPDIAVANGGGTNDGDDDVSVLLGNGDGTFLIQQRFDVGDNPRSVAIGDLNGDGTSDLAVANNRSHDVSILLGNGDGTFQTEQRFGAGTSPRSVAIGDLDGDEAPDLAVANTNSDDVSVLLGNGDGTFLIQQRYGAGDGAHSVAIGDLDGDGAFDLAVANEASDDVSVLLGNGEGTFQSEQRFGAGELPRSVAIGDFIGDETPDLAVANFSSDDVSVLLGNGDGTFQSEQRFGAGNAPFSVAIGELDGDGTPDLAVANVNGDVSVLLNQSVSYWTGASIAFNAPQSWSGGVAPSTDVPTVAGFDSTVEPFGPLAFAQLQSDAAFFGWRQANERVELLMNGQNLNASGVGLALGVRQAEGPDPLPIAPPELLLNNTNGSSPSVFSAASATVGVDGPATLELNADAGDATLDVPGDFVVGEGGAGTVRIADDAAGASIAYGGPDEESLVVGGGADGTIEVLRGCMSSSGGVSSVVLGRDAGVTGAVRIDGVSSTSPCDGTWSHSGTGFTVGRDGHGVIEILNGARLETSVTNTITLAETPGSSSSVLVSGAGSEWDAGFSLLETGEGESTITVEDGGTLAGLGFINTARSTIRGDGTISSPIIGVTNFGTIAPSSGGTRGGNMPVTLTIDGDYDQFDNPLDPEISGRVLIEAFESDGTVTSDMLSITGEANLAGGLLVTSSAPLDPDALASTTVLQASAVNGRFDVAFLPGVVPDAQGGRFLRVEYPDDIRSNNGSSRGVVTVNLIVNTLENSIQLESAEAFDVNGSPVAADVGDLNNDGLIDVALALPDEIDPAGAPGDAIVLFNAGNFGDIWGGFASSVQFAAPPDPTDIAIGNIDASGGLDLAVSSRAINAARLYRNDGLGLLGSITVDQDIVISGAASSVVFGELDEDKWDDLIIANPENDSIDVIDNTLGGVFAPPAPVPVGAGVSAVSAGDLDGNGFDDAVTTNPADGSVSIVLRNMDGTFQPSVDLPALGTPGSAVLLDLDDDGDLDIAYTSDNGSGTNTVQVLRNDLTDGQVIFSPASAIDTGGNPVYLFSADVDDDGQEDLLALNADSGARGAGPFDDVSVVRQSAALCAGDCNEDGSVNFSDLVAMLGQFGTAGSNPGCDADQSGTVDFNDLVAALGVFGACE